MNIKIGEFMDNKRFKMIDENFICEVCNKEVLKLNVTARDHCPYCLCSKHVDVNPGDRSADCGGILIPIDIEKSKKDTYKIIYKCNTCGIIKKNKTAYDDNFDKILEIMKKDI